MDRPRLSVFPLLRVEVFLILNAFLQSFFPWQVTLQFSELASL